MVTVTFYITQAGQLALQTGGLAGLTNLKCDLCTAIPTPPAFLAVLADFTLPTYTGYVQSAVVLTGGYVDGALLDAFALSGLVSFVGPTSGTGADIVGFLLQDGTSHKIWAWAAFDGPLPELAATDVIAFVIRLYENLTAQVPIVSPN